MKKNTLNFYLSILISLPTIIFFNKPSYAFIPTIYEPVCGCDGFTYSNKSAAECNGVLNYYEGPCR